MKYTVTSVAIGQAESPTKLKQSALKDIKEITESKGGDPEGITLDDIILHRVAIRASQDSTLEIWEAIGDERLHKKKFSESQEMEAYLSRLLRGVDSGNRF